MEEPVDKVLEWRQRELERAGFGPTIAHLLACDRSLDLHKAVELVKIGCPIDLAVRILS